MSYLKAKLNQSNQLRVYQSYMADCSQFLVNFWAGEKVIDVSYYDLVMPAEEMNVEEADAEEIVERIKGGLNKLARS